MGQRLSHDLDYLQFLLSKQSFQMLMNFCKSFEKLGWHRVKVGVYGRFSQNVDNI